MTKGRINDKLCVINDAERANALAADATVFCGQCGAVAHDPNSVCHPLPFAKKGGK
jgi:hypothetical protein